MTRIEETTRILAPLERCFDLARSIEVHLAGNIHFGEQALVSGGVNSGLIGLSQSVTWRAKHFGMWQTLTSAITKMKRPVYFQDSMVRGPFRFMRHDHHFQFLSAGETMMTDVFCFASPLGPLGILVDWLVLRHYMRSLLRERNLVVKQIAESSEWQRYLPEVSEWECKERRDHEDADHHTGR